MIPFPRLRIVLILTITGIGLMATAVSSASAGQWTGYAAVSDPHQLVPFNTADNSVGTPIALTNHPRDVAIAADGKTVYVLAGSPDRLIPVSAATGVAGSPALIPGAVSLLAVTPDGSAAYAAEVNEGRVFRVDLVTGSVSDPINVGHKVWGIAIHPDGQSAYVTGSSSVSRIDLSNGAVTPIGATGASMKGIAFRPDGLSGYAISPGFNTVYPIDVTAGVLKSHFSAGFQPSEIAITPDGKLGFVVNFSSNKVTVLDLVAGKEEGDVTVGNTPSDVAISPDGKTAFVANELSGDVTPIDIATLTAGAPIPVTADGAPRWIAITPNQPPTAKLTAGPAWAGEPVRLDASASTDLDSAITRYEWDFGDGTGTVTTDPVVEHVFPKGPQTISVTLTDETGCSAEIVFTGQTASCNGSAELAETTLSLTVADKPPAPPSPPADDGNKGGDGPSGQPGDKGRSGDGDRPRARPARLAAIKVMPRRRAASAGSAVRFRLRLRNTGGKATGRLRICVKVPKRSVLPTRCRPVRNVRAGRTVTSPIALRLRRGLRSGTRVKVAFRISGKRIKPRAARAIIRVR